MVQGLASVHLLTERKTVIQSQDIFQHHVFIYPVQKDLEAARGQFLAEATVTVLALLAV